MKKKLIIFIDCIFILSLALVLSMCGGDNGIPPPSGELDNANLSDLTLSSGSLNPSFSADITSYTVKFRISIQSLKVIPTAEDPDATIKVNGNICQSGQASGSITMNLGENDIIIEVISPDGNVQKTYTVTATRGITVQEAYLKASNTESKDYFGLSVAISGNTIVVGGTCS